MDDSNKTSEVVTSKEEITRREILDWILHIAVAIVAAILIVTFIGQITIVSKRSMTQTLQNGDRLIVEKITTRFGSLETGDIVVIYYPECLEKGSLIIKRVVAKEGDRVQIRGGKVYINGQVLQEDYIRGERTETVNETYSDVTLPKGYLYVLGDNRLIGGSIDSRTFGPIEESRIRGRAIFRIFPIKEAGRVGQRH